MNAPFLTRGLLLLLFGAVAMPPALPAADAGASRTRMELAGQWRFFPDYPAKGEEFGWHKPGIEESSWDQVEVPHIWNLEPRYDYTGPAWYRLTFSAPELPAGQHARILLGAVFYKSKVWLNGVALGEHEGGYTAFEFDATTALKPGADNLLVVRADNSWSTETIPGSRVGNQPRDLTYPWWNFGGIKKPVYLELSAPVYIANQKIVATPDLVAGTAAIAIKVWVRNATTAPQQRRIRVRVRRPGSWDAAGSAETTLNLPPRTTLAADLASSLPADRVALWDFDHPNLYQSFVEVFEGAAPNPADMHLARFGIRKLENRGARLLFNGEPVSFGGANRSADHPRFGSMETPQVRHPPRSGWLDELGRLKDGRPWV